MRTSRRDQDQGGHELARRPSAHVEALAQDVVEQAHREGEGRAEGEGHELALHAVGFLQQGRGSRRSAAGRPRSGRRRGARRDPTTTTTAKERKTAMPPVRGVGSRWTLRGPGRSRAPRRVSRGRGSRARGRPRAAKVAARTRRRSPLAHSGSRLPGQELPVEPVDVGEEARGRVLTEDVGLTGTCAFLSGARVA